MQNFLMSNLIFILVILFLLFGLITGFKMGFLKKLLSFGSIIISIFCTKTFTPEVVKIVKDYTNIQSSLSDNLNKTFNETSILDKMDLSKIQNVIDIESMNLSIKEYVSTNLSNLLLNILCGIAVFLVTMLILKIIIKFLDIVDIIPIVGQINKLFGGVLGVFQSLLLIWIVFAVLKFLSVLPPVKDVITNNIENTFFLNYIYENNIVYNFFANLIKA